MNELRLLSVTRDVISTFSWGPIFFFNATGLLKNWKTSTLYIVFGVIHSSLLSYFFLFSFFSQIFFFLSFFFFQRKFALPLPPLKSQMRHWPGRRLKLSLYSIPGIEIEGVALAGGYLKVKIDRSLLAFGSPQILLGAEHFGKTDAAARWQWVHFRNCSCGHRMTVSCERKSEIGRFTRSHSIILA